MTRGADHPRGGADDIEGKIRPEKEGPLAWFGVVGIEDVEMCLTLPGAALLGREDGAWSAGPDPAPLHVGSHSGQADGDAEPALLLNVPAGLPLPDRFALEAIVPPDSSAPAVYRLTRSHFLRAVQRGHTVEGVANFLERASGEPLPAPALGALYRWDEASGRVVIRQAVLLQTREPGTLRDLTARRRIRETLGDTLNARSVEVRADRVDALLRRLARRGIVPRVDVGGDGPSLPAALPDGAKGVQDEAELAAIAVALRVYAHLADSLGLSARPAYALIRRWSEGLLLPLRDAVERAVEQTLAALHRAAPLEMEDHLPAPTGPLLERLERAIQEQATVEIEYYTAGRAHHTTRRVDPLRLEWHGDVVYLVAYCHLRGGQRVFRVDRIEEVKREA